MNDKNPAPPSQTLAKAILLLESFSLENPEWGIRELGRDLGINPTTVHRLVSTLQIAGYLEQDSKTQRYVLGPRIMKLAGVYVQLNPIPTVARKVFEQYADDFEYNFYLGMLNQFEMIYMAVLDGRGPIKIVIEPGGSTSLHTTAIGKVLLAFQDDAFIEGFIQNASLTAMTARSITDPEQLRAQLRRIRSQGYAVNDGEHYEDVGAVGVPVFEDLLPVRLGVSLAYPQHLIPRDRLHVDRLVELARQIAEEIAARIGMPFQVS